MLLTSLDKCHTLHSTLGLDLLYGRTAVHGLSSWNAGDKPDSLLLQISLQTLQNSRFLCCIY